MTRGFAGMLVRGGGRRERAVRQVEAALAGDEPAQVFVDGPLVAGWAGLEPGAVLQTDELLCVLDGVVYELDAADSGSAADPGAAAVAAACSRGGHAAIASLRGDFTLLLWDRRSGSGLLARDHMGGGGGVYADTPTGLAFGSELPHVLRLVPSCPAPDDVAAAHWIALGGQPGGRTLFAGVTRLEAAHVMALGRSPAAPTRYWSPAYRRPLQAPREELTDRLRVELRRAAERRVTDGASTAILLSGGLDSAAVGALATLDPDPRGRAAGAYSAVFPSLPTVDESEQIDRLTAAYALRSVRIAVRGGSVLAGALPYLARWRLPPATPNLFFWSPLLARAAADGTRVMLDGEGGDELFGLSPYLLADRLGRGRMLAASALVRRLPGATPRSAGRIARVVRTFGVKGAAPWWMHAVARQARGAGHYAPGWMRPAAARAWLESESGFDWKRLDGPRWWSYLVDATTRGIGPDLVYEQSRCRAAMAGIAPRHPLVDVDVIELVLSLPPELAFDRRHSRPLLREAMLGLVPEPVRLRPTKSSFDALFHQALGGCDLPVARRLLGDPAARVGAYVDLAGMRRALLDRAPPEAPGPRQAWAISVWRLLTLEVWMRGQEDPRALDELAADPELSAADFELLAG